MSEREPSGTSRDCGNDVAAYVLGALEHHEEEAFRRHLQDCVVCRDEVGALRRAADALPMAAPQHRPSRALKRRVMRAVRDDAQGQQARGRRRTTRPGLLAGLSAPRGALAGLATLAALAVAAFLGTELNSTHGGAARVIHAQVSGGGSAELRLTGGHAVLIVRHVPPPRLGHVYEVWLKRPDERPAPTTALFGTTNAGTGEVAVPGDLRGVAAVLVTQEPAGGSLAPTTPPLIVASLA